MISTITHREATIGSLLHFLQVAAMTVGDPPIQHAAAGWAAPRPTPHFSLLLGGIGRGVFSFRRLA
jgi:hypothetical protein